MKQFIAAVVAVGVIGGTIGAAHAGEMKAASLDGKTFKIEFAGAMASQGPDWLVFDGTMFQSTACHAYGFTPATYTCTGAGKSMGFDAMTTSPDQGKIHWSGTANGDKIEGTFSWTNAKGETQEAKFTGTAVNGALDGKTFALKLEGGDASAASTEDQNDTVMFRNGTFDSQACRSYGFGVSSYTATKSGGTVTFDVKAMSAAGGTNTWHGTVHGKMIEGTLVSMDKDGKAMHFTYKGTLAG